MKYLIDTHTMLWFLFDNERISKTATETIISNKGFVFASIASLWEIAIKIRINKLNIKYHPNDLIEFCRKEYIGILNITPQHVNETLNLPLIHRDPFDRMLIAQANVEDMILLTCDQNIPQYPIKTLW